RASYSKIDWRLGSASAWKILSLTTAALCILYIFKQKTAYEIGQRLEFRRVLFRSMLALTALPSAISASITASIRARRRPDPWYRSEERRVGKEWRSRWAPGQ